LLSAIDILKSGRNPPDEINVVVEIPKASSIKYEIDPKSGEISMDRMLFPAMFYPFNYGFIPQTREEDGDDGGADPIDVFILGNYSLMPKSVIVCRPVGVLLTEDQGGIDPKIVSSINKDRSHLFNYSRYQRHSRKRTNAAQAFY
jgi:inorganic pyrophosphatase